MDECNPNRSGTKRKRLGKKVILVVIAAILTHSLVLASIAAPLYLQAPAFLDGTGGLRQGVSDCSEVGKEQYSGGKYDGRGHQKT